MITWRQQGEAVRAAGKNAIVRGVGFEPTKAFATGS